MPGEFVILSLPPWLRYKVNNILMSVLIPESMTAGSQRKFFRRMIKDEFNVLVRTGITTPWGNMKVKVFAQVCRHVCTPVSVHYYIACITCITHCITITHCVTESRFEGA